MIVEKNKFGFKIVEYWLEDKKAEELTGLTNKYSKIFLLSYEKKELEEFLVKTKKTPLIDLRGDKDEVFYKFSETARKKIKRAQRDKELRLVIEDKDFDKAYNLYKTHAWGYGQIPEGKKEFKNCLIFSAYFKDELISVIFCFVGDRAIRAKAICSQRFLESRQDIKKVISNATYGLIWEICKYAKEKKYKYFDLGSVNLDDSARQGNVHFKKSFGSEIVDEYYYVYKSGFYKMFEKLIKIKLLLSKFSK